MEVRLEFAGMVTREQVGSMYGGEEGIGDGSVEYFPWNTDAIQGERTRGGRPGAAGTGEGHVGCVGLANNPRGEDPRAGALGSWCFGV